MDSNDVVRRVAEVCPKFNDFALRQFVQDSIDNSHHFIALVFREGFKLVKADLELVKYETLSPEDRVKFELKTNPNKSSPKSKIPLTVSHFRAVRYTVRLGAEFHECTLYTPYMFDGMLFVRDKRSMVRKVILEQTLSRVSEREKDGVTVSPIRVNMMFNRRATFRVVSYVTGEAYSHFIVTARLFHGTIKHKVCETTIIHYMLAKFGFPDTLRKFGLSKSDVSFVPEVGSDTETFEYFGARRFADKSGDGPGLFLKVRKTILGDDQARKFVVNLLYVLSFFDIQSMENVYVEPGWAEHLSVWKIILGIIIFGEYLGPKAHSNAVSHINSVDYFIDPLTRERFKTFKVDIEDTYDLLVYIFKQIDTFMVNNQPQDLYSSRLDVTNGILVESFAKRIFRNLYPLVKKSNITMLDVKKALSLNAMMFKQPSSIRKDEAENYIAPPEIIGDNYLLSGGLNKLRIGGKAEQRLHPSQLVAESIDAFVGKHIGRTGFINPYVPTNAHGAIERPDYVSEIDAIERYLPR